MNNFAKNLLRFVLGFAPMLIMLAFREEAKLSTILMIFFIYATFGALSAGIIEILRELEKLNKKL